ARQEDFFFPLTVARPPAFARHPLLLLDLAESAAPADVEVLQQVVQSNPHITSTFPGSVGADTDVVDRDSRRRLRSARRVDLFPAGLAGGDTRVRRLNQMLT